MQVIGRSEAIRELAEWGKGLQGAQRAVAAKAVAVVSGIAAFDHSPWHDARRRLPERGTACLVYGRTDGIRYHDVALWDGKKWEFGAENAFAVTHWMRLPEVPEEEI